MPTTVQPSEEGQLAQTIEMFEVITQSDPQDYQSLEILREAYTKLGRKDDIARTSKRLAEAYVAIGQFSSAILEYESILQHFPDDPEVLKALKEIENKANNAPPSPPPGPKPLPVSSGDTLVFQKAAAPQPVASSAEIEDGRRTMQKLFVDGKLIAFADFDACWPMADLSGTPREVVKPFIQILEEKGLLPTEKSLKILCDKSRVAYVPLNLYDLDIELSRSFPSATCRRWCVLPFDRMSNSILVATANPFNQQAAKELAAATTSRLLWYLVPPDELVKTIRKAFR